MGACFDKPTSTETSATDLFTNLDDSALFGELPPMALNRTMTLAFNRRRTDRHFQSSCLILRDATRQFSIRAQASVDPESIPISMATKTIRNDEIRNFIHQELCPIEKPLEKYGVIFCSSYKEYYENRDDLIDPYELNLQKSQPSWKKSAAGVIEKIKCMKCSKQWQLIEHIGSTSIPGLIAKPIIDLMIALKKDQDFNNFIEQFLEQQSKFDDLPIKIAFTSKAPCHGDDWGFFQIPKEAARKFNMLEVNIHVFLDGTKNVKEKLLFRDFLSSPEGNTLKEEYSQIKKKLMEKLDRNELSVSEYSRNKTEIVIRILTAAKKWDKQHAEGISSNNTSDIVRWSALTPTQSTSNVTQVR